jgi:hypothetical protein
MQQRIDSIQNAYMFAKEGGIMFKEFTDLERAKELPTTCITLAFQLS